MSDPHASKPAFKLNLSKLNTRKGSKRNHNGLHQSRGVSSDLTHSASSTSSSSRSATQNQNGVSKNNHRTKDTPIDLDSFLADLPDSAAGEIANVRGDTDLLDQEGSAGETNVHLKTRPKTNGTSKLNKISTDYSLHPFTKQVYRAVSPAAGDSDFRELNGIHVDESCAESEDPTNLAPIISWHSAGLPLPMMRVLESRNYLSPTPIQAQSLPIIMRGHDMLGIAPTGSGKTAAFLIPLCRHIAANISNYQRMGSRGPFGLVIVPTRELCIQIQRELLPWAESLQLNTLSCYGGSDISSQISALVNNKCHVVIATPGRLIDLLSANNGRVMSLRAVTFLVIDETDRMFDLGFGPQVRKILESIRPDRQTVVFSATMPKQLEGLVHRILHQPVKVWVSNEREQTNGDHGNSSSVPQQVSQSAYLLASDEAKIDKLCEVLTQASEISSSIVFVNTQTLADSLALKLASHGFRCQALHGGMDQRDRDDVLTEFRVGNLPVLVATSVAARGLDVKNLKLVVNYDPPSHLEDYVHRAGRTGRAGMEGDCVSLLLPSQDKEAFYLTQFFDPGSEIASMAERYANTHRLHDANQSKYKHSGFGGHGLSKLDKKRDIQKSIEREAYTEESTSTVRQATPDTEDSVVKKTGNNTFIARLIINDGPKEARVAVTAVAKQTEIMDNYHVSLTLKGTYYAVPKPGIAPDAVLHLQIEGPIREDVAAAYNDLYELMEQKSSGMKPQGKYSFF